MIISCLDKNYSNLNIFMVAMPPDREMIQNNNLHKDFEHISQWYVREYAVYCFFFTFTRILNPSVLPVPINSLLLQP